MLQDLSLAGPRTSRLEVDSGAVMRDEIIPSIEVGGLDIAVVVDDFPVYIEVSAMKLS